MLPFKIDPREKVAVFIDGTALHSDAKHCGFNVDFKRLFAHIEQQSPDEVEFDLNYVTDYYYYIQRRDAYSESGYSLQPLLDWLAYNGVRIISKDKVDPKKEIDLDNRFFSFISEFTMDVMIAAATVDHFIFFTNDGAYSNLLRHLRSINKRITLCSIFNTQSQDVQGGRRVVDSLRRNAQYFIEINDLKPYIRQVDKTELPTAIIKKVANV